jgi:hypothetical protein
MATAAVKRFTSLKHSESTANFKANDADMAANVRQLTIKKYLLI